MEQTPQVAVVMVPLPAQGHLNPFLHFSCLISSHPQHNCALYFVGPATHNRQSRVRSTADVTKIHFHDLATPPFASPPSDPNAPQKSLTHLQPAWNAATTLRRPFASFLQKLSEKFKRVVVIHDPMMSVVVQDVAAVDNAESYAFYCGSAFTMLWFMFEELGKPFPIDQYLPTIEGCLSDELQSFIALQKEPLKYRAGDIHNTCRSLEGRYLELLEKEERINNGNRKLKMWSIAPLLPAKLSRMDHKCLDWLDNQEPKSVIFVSFGTTTSLSDGQIKELAFGLEQSKVKFIWVLRDADKGDVFDEESRRAELPEGFEGRSVGIVVRDWAPQPQILAHKSIGGFMSHCGWNSCMESITMGVPMAAWPMHTDQPRNAVLITEILKMGLVVREWAKRMEVVKASTIENVVKRLMVSEEGVELRKRAEELGDAVRRASEDGGTSRLELDSFMAQITR